jgi:hypothetical protein
MCFEQYFVFAGFSALSPLKEIRPFTRTTNIDGIISIATAQFFICSHTIQRKEKDT